MILPRASLFYDEFEGVARGPSSWMYVREFRVNALACLLLSTALFIVAASIPSPPRVPPLTQPRSRLRSFIGFLAIVSAGASIFLFLLQSRSHHVGDYLTLASGFSVRDLYSELGVVRYERRTSSEPWPTSLSYTTVQNPAGYIVALRPALQWDARPDCFSWSFPFWPLILAFLVLPVVWSIRFGLPRWTAAALAWAAVLWPFELSFAVGGGFEAFWFVRTMLFATCLALVLLFILEPIRKALARRPAPWPWQFRKRRIFQRQQLGLCLVCGYDLRGSPNRCPECGATTT
jgi:hypothetical protein